MLDLILSLVVGPRVGNTCLAHREAIAGHPLVAKVFFPDLAPDEPAPAADDTFLASGYGVTC